MGWFINAVTPNRCDNIHQLSRIDDAIQATRAGIHKEIGSIRQVTQLAKTENPNLLAQHGPQSDCLKDIAGAVASLARYERKLVAVLPLIDRNAASLQLITDQYKLPRSARMLCLSGRDLVKVARARVMEVKKATDPLRGEVAADAVAATTLITLLHKYPLLRGK
jgi:hypothetical protein